MPIRFPLNKTIPRARLAGLVAHAESSPFADGSVSYPDWYLQKWHFLPEGYLSQRSVNLYDKVIRRIYHAGTDIWACERIVRLLGRRRPATIAEIGCGAGHLLRALSEGLPEAQVTGYDLSPFMLASARARAGARVRLRHANMCDLGARDAEFDAVVAVHVLGHVPRPVCRLAVGEAWRLLKPGGLLVSVEHNWHRVQASDSFVAAYSEQVGAARLTLWQRQDAPPAESPQPQHAAVQGQRGSGLE